ncbi:hypothetical protein F5Y10DRAFT_227652 [Nemania abortiva]|nr:hypothetical protein F5Y10DRAFT_227652 [Nemania abortiva]
MRWATNPYLRSPKATEPATADAEAAQSAARIDGAASPDPKDSDELKILPPSDHLTLRQFIYIVILHGIGSALISGGINFAIAYALYHDKGTNDSPIRLFQFPNTLAGDTAVTIFVQFLITWMVECHFVNWDLRKGVIQPIGFIREPRRKFIRWFMFLDRHVEAHEASSLKHWLAFLLSQVIRSLVVVAATFVVIWGACVGFLTLVGKHHGEDWDWYYTPLWTPELFKLIQGAALGLFFTPPMAMLWLVRCGWDMQG